MAAESRPGLLLVGNVLGSPRARLAILAVLLVAAFVAMLLVGAPNRGAIERIVRESGAVAPVVYTLGYAALTVLLVPGAVITAAGGSVFGPVLATVLTVVGATAGSTVAFLIGRALGRAQVEAIAGRRIGRLDDWLARRGFLAVLYLRLLPVVPFNAFNYAAGVSAVRLRDYVLATMVGIVPGTFLYAALGGAIDRPTSPQFLVAAGLLVVLALLGPVLNRRFGARTGVPARQRRRR